MAIVGSNLLKNHVVLNNLHAMSMVLRSFQENKKKLLTNNKNDNLSGRINRAVKKADSVYVDNLKVHHKIIVNLVKTVSPKISKSLDKISITQHLHYDAYTSLVHRTLIKEKTSVGAIEHNRDDVEYMKLLGKLYKKPGFEKFHKIIKSYHSYDAEYKDAFKTAHKEIIKMGFDISNLDEGLMSVIKNILKGAFMTTTSTSVGGFTSDGSVNSRNANREGSYSPTKGSAIKCPKCKGKMSGKTGMYKCSKCDRLKIKEAINDILHGHELSEVIDGLV